MTTKIRNFGLVNCKTQGIRKIFKTIINICRNLFISSDGQLDALTKVRKKLKRSKQSKRT